MNSHEGFCFWLLSLSVMFPRPIQAVDWVSTVPLFVDGNFPVHGYAATLPAACLTSAETGGPSTGGRGEQTEPHTHSEGPPPYATAWRSLRALC